MARVVGVASWSRGLRVLALPLIAAAIVLVAIPAVMTVMLAFTDYDAVSAPRWNGFANFARLWRDPIFATSVWNSLIYVAISVPLRMVAAVGTALLLAGRRRGTATGRALVYLPTVVPDVAYALLWLWVFNPLYGPLALAMQAIGLPGPELLLSAWGARFAVAIMSAFQIGEGFIVALAVRNDIPHELYELAEIDGARPSWTLRRVTLPLMMPVLLLLAARDVVLSLQGNFVPALVLTNGGPEYATTFLPLYTYQNAFEYLRFGYASAMTLTMFAVTAAMIGVQVLIVRRRREGRGEGRQEGWSP
ncbi:MAG TPA: sugar ABC transporter permease [Actinomycetota bacterium]